MKKPSQISESIELGIILALAGGFMDAYSYMCRGQVFANAQTGNMLLFGIYLVEGNFSKALRYFFPVFSFATGIFITDFVRSKFDNVESIHWRQIAVLFEAVILLLVSFMPQSLNLPANCLTSFACAIQVESFRKILGNGIATTMCIGNLRSATQNLFDYFSKKDKEAGKRSALYYGIIVSFVIGAIIGDKFVKVIGIKAIAVNSMVLFSAFLMMFINLDKCRSFVSNN